MSATFLTTRLSDTSFVSQVDNAVRDLDSAIAEFFGITLDQAHEAVMAVDQYGFITAMQTLGVKVYDHGLTSGDPSTDKYVLLKFDEDGDDSYLIFEDTATSVGVSGVEIGKLKLTDHIGSLDVYAWVNETGVLSISKYGDESENKTILRLPLDTDEDREIIHVPTFDTDDAGKTVIIGDDGAAALGISATVYLTARPNGVFSGVGSAADPCYPTILGVAEESISIIGSTQIRFAAPGTFKVDGMIQASILSGAASAECLLIPHPSGSQIPGSAVKVTGGGTLDDSGSGWGNCAFGGTVIVTQDNLDAGVCDLAVRLVLGSSTVNFVGEYGYLSINRIQGA